MTEVVGLFEGAAEFDPGEDFELFAKRVPACWAVYLMSDEAGLPVQLLCVRNLRASLRRRLGPPEADAPRSKRVDYRQIVRRIQYRRVDSNFEADWLYYEAARVIFPRTYQGMVGFRSAWFVHVNPDTAFPRYTKTVDPTHRTGVYLGPLEDKHAAARLMQLAEDAFDLCRYYNILVEAPRGSACAYKEMGKCPAPCDGTISMDAYREVVALSVRALIDPKPLIREHEQRMRLAAGELKFEIAGKIKQHIEQLSQIGKAAFRYVRPLGEFRYLSLQHGPIVGSAKVLVITPGGVAHVASLIAEPSSPSSLLRLVFELGQQTTPQPLAQEQVERLGVVSHHLFNARSQHGVFLPIGEVDDRSLAKGYRDLIKQKRPEESEAEGTLKELDGGLEGDVVRPES